MIPFAIGSTVAWALLVLFARTLRGPLYARFAAVLVGLHTVIAVAMIRYAGRLAPLFALLSLTVYLHFASLIRARMRPLAWRVLVSVPGCFFAAGTMLAMPWAVVSAFGVDPWVPWLPYALGLVGIVQSFWTQPEEIDVLLDGASVSGDRVQPHPRGAAREARPLRIVQISDPHLGPFMSVRRLRSICERAVARDPDVILLTGDFLTMESQSSPHALTEALAPLRAMAGRTFACRGNHDLEAPTVVASALESAHVKLLIDDEAAIETDAGPVQIVGADFVRRNRAEHLDALCARFPRREGHLRVVLLHDPGAFRHLPRGEGDLVLSGHTHGGQVGLVSLGLAWTFVRAFGRMPDHGLWARGRDRLYVHRGTGHYGFPLRLGVPSEESVLRVHRAATAT